MSDYTIEEKITKLTEENKAIKQKLKDNTTEAVSLLKTLIQETPEVEAIRWAQYVPSFNDGVPCVFQLSALEIKFDPEKFPVHEELDKTDREDDESKWMSDDYIEEFLTSQEDVLNFGTVAEIEKKIKRFHSIYDLLSANEEALQVAFGENARVIVTRSGIETEHYDCGY